MLTHEGFVKDLTSALNGNIVFAVKNTRNSSKLDTSLIDVDFNLLKSSFETEELPETKT